MSLYAFHSEMQNLGDQQDLPYCAFDHPSPFLDEIGLPQFQINLSNLSLVVQDTIYRIAGRGPGINLTMMYNPAPQIRGMFGTAWSFQYESLIRWQQDRLWWKKGSGNVSAFRFDPARTGFWPENFQGTPADSPFITVATDVQPGGSLPRKLCLRDPVNRTELHFRLQDSQDYLLESMDDTYGNRLQLVYDNRQLVQLVDPAGRKIQFEFNAAGLCQALRLPDDRQATFGYDGEGRLVHVLDLAGVPIEYEYNHNYLISSIKIGKSKRTITFGYSLDSKRPVISRVVNEIGSSTTYRTQPDGSITVTPPTGQSRTYHHRHGCLQRVSDSSGSLSELSYHNSALHRSTDAQGREREWTYDSQGRLAGVQSSDGWELHYSYDAEGQLTGIVSNSVNIDIEYDQSGNPVRISGVEDLDETLNYNQFGQLVQHTLPSGRRLEFSYDQFGNRSAITAADGSTVRFGYDRWGLRLSSVTDPAGSCTEITRDGNDRVIEYRYPGGLTDRFEYTCCALCQVERLGKPPTRYQLNPNLTVAQQWQGSGQPIEFGYDQAGRMTEMKLPNGAIHRYSFDSMGRRNRLEYPDGQAVQLSYDDRGWLTEIQGPGTLSKRFRHDPSSRSTEEIDEFGNSITRSFDASGNLKRMKNRRGDCVTFRQGRTVAIVSKDNPETPIAVVKRNADGLIQGIADETGVTRFEYDRGLRCRRIIYPDGSETAYEYDANDRPIQVRYPSGLEVRYRYDANGRAQEVVWDNNRVDLSYSTAGDLQSINYSNGWKTEWDFAGHEISGVLHSQNRNAEYRAEYQYDVVGNLARAVVETDWCEASWDEGELKMEFNAAGQLVRRGAAELGYDPDGNLIEIRKSDSHIKFTYDAFNRMTGWATSAGQRTFAYNAIGQRVNVSYGDRQQFIYHGIDGEILEVRGADAEPVRSFVYGNGELLAARDGDQGRFFHFDRLGSVVLVSGQSGQITDRFCYDVFGRPHHQGDTDYRLLFSFVGRQGVVDDGDGYFHMRNRCYSATLGRFLQRDPIGFEGGFHDYLYVNNNPVNEVDPAGLSGGKVYSAVDPATRFVKGQYAVSQHAQSSSGWTSKLPGAENVDTGIKVVKAVSQVPDAMKANPLKPINIALQNCTAQDNEPPQEVPEWSIGDIIRENIGRPVEWIKSLSLPDWLTVGSELTEDPLTLEGEYNPEGAKENTKWTGKFSEWFKDLTSDMSLDNAAQNARDGKLDDGDQPEGLGDKIWPWLKQLGE